MKGIHPSMKTALWWAFAAAAVGCAGCRSSSSSSANPFVGPDRVPPPATRALAPGQAQPYYQGDPLPVMQSSASAPANPAVANSTTTLSSTGKTLAWNAPASTSGGNPAGSTTNSPWDAQPQPSAPLAYGNEPPVSVPADASDLRFAAPAASPPSPATPSAVAQSAATPQPPPAAVTAPTAPSNQGVAQASYNVPVSGGLTPVVTTPELSPTPHVASPWQSPQVGNTAALTGTAIPSAAPSPGASAPATVIPPVPLYVLGQPPTALPTNVMPVEMRAVPSPPPQPGDPLPRVRIPTYDVPQTATADGFRPRSSMR